MLRSIFALAASAFAAPEAAAPSTLVAEEFCQYQWNYGWYNFYTQFNNNLNFTAYGALNE